MRDPVEEARELIANAGAHKYEPEPEGKSTCVKCGADGWNRDRSCTIDYRPLPRLVRALSDECVRLRAEVEARPAITEDDIDAIREGIYGDDRMSRKTLEAALAALSRVAHASQPKGDGKGFIR